MMVEHESEILARRKFDSVEAYKHVGEEDDVKIKDYIGAIGKAPYQMTFYRDWQDYPLFDRKLSPRWSSLLCGRRPAEG